MRDRLECIYYCGSWFKKKSWKTVHWCTSVLIQVLSHLKRQGGNILGLVFCYSPTRSFHRSSKVDSLILRLTSGPFLHPSVFEAELGKPSCESQFWFPVLYSRLQPTSSPSSEAESPTPKSLLTHVSQFVLLKFLFHVLISAQSNTLLHPHSRFSPAPAFQQQPSPGSIFLSMDRLQCLLFLWIL